MDEWLRSLEPASEDCSTWSGYDLGLRVQNRAPALSSCLPLHSWSVSLSQVDQMVSPIKYKMTSFASLPYELRSQIWKQALLTSIPTERLTEEDLAKYREKMDEEFNVDDIHMWDGSKENLLPLNLLRTSASNGDLAVEAQEIFFSHVEAFFMAQGLLRFFEARYSPARFLTRVSVQPYFEDILNKKFV